MNLSPAVAIHLFAALAALAIGPLALWARRRGQARPRLHRAAGYAWVTLMVATALSALFITSRIAPGLGGFGPIHLLIPVTLGALVLAFWHLWRGRVQAHRYTMLSLYLGACVITGALTLLPGRTLGRLVWGDWLGLL